MYEYVCVRICMCMYTYIWVNICMYIYMSECLYIYIYSVCLVHIHYKLIRSYLCNAEQNNKASLKNNNGRFIFMTESRLVSE